MNAIEDAATERWFEAIQQDDGATVAALLTSRPALLEARSAGGLRPLTAAVYSGASASIRALLEHGAELDIFDAAALGATDRLHELLHRQPDLAHAYSDDGWTALHLAGHFGRTAAAAALLEHGADLSARSHNRNGNTALHAALAGRQAETVVFLLDRGADVSVADAAGYTPLHLAAHQGNVALVRRLLDAGADPDARTVEGTTAREMAAGEGHAEVVALLGR